MKVGDCAGIIAQRYFHPGDWSLYLLTKVSAGLLFSSFSTLIQVVRFGKKKKKKTHPNLGSVKPFPVSTMC